MSGQEKLVCVLPCVPLRAEPNDRSEQVSQILAGEAVLHIEDCDGNWFKLKSCADDYVGYVKDVTGGWMEAYGEFLGDSYFIDFTEYNKADLQETKIEKLKHRFNTSYRECGNGICDEFLLDVTDDNFGISKDAKVACLGSHFVVQYL